MALILPFLLAGFLAFMGVSITIPQESGQVPVSQTLGGTGAQAGSYAATLDFLALTRAALAYSEANPPQNQNYTASQLVSYMGGYSFPPNWTAQVKNGSLTVWTNSATASAMGVVGAETTTDCAYGFVQNGEMVSQCGGAGLGTAPQGAADGDLIWTIAYPHNENN
ncbi:MAG: type IV pilus biogenesis protein PilM [Acidithiobacillus sp.]